MLFICIGMNIFTIIVYNDPIKWLPTVDNDNIALKVGLIKGFIISIISIITSIIIQELTANIFWSEIYEKGLMIKIANMLFADKFNIKSFLVPWWKIKKTKLAYICLFINICFLIIAPLLGVSITITNGNRVSKDAINIYSVYNYPYDVINRKDSSYMIKYYEINSLTNPQRGNDGFIFPRIFPDDVKIKLSYDTGTGIIYEGNALKLITNCQINGKEILKTGDLLIQRDENFVNIYIRPNYTFSRVWSLDKIDISNTSVKLNGKIQWSWKDNIGLKEGIVESYECIIDIYSMNGIIIQNNLLGFFSEIYNYTSYSYMIYSLASQWKNLVQTIPYENMNITSQYVAYKFGDELRLIMLNFTSYENINKTQIFEGIHEASIVSLLYIPASDSILTNVTYLEKGLIWSTNLITSFFITSISIFVIITIFFIEITDKKKSFKNYGLDIYKILTNTSISNSELQKSNLLKKEEFELDENLILSIK